MTDDEMIQRNAHIPTEEIERDIAETRAEITQMEAEQRHLLTTPVTSQDYRWNQMRAAARRDGIVARWEFIGRMQRILKARGIEAEVSR